MTPHPIAIEEDKTLGEAIDLMIRKKIRRMLVTKDGEITGISNQRAILSLNRICLYCGKEIKSVLELGSGTDRYIECECGWRYHTRCANSVVHYVDCKDHRVQCHIPGAVRDDERVAQRCTDYNL